MLGRASVLLILGLAALPGCHRDGTEDPAIAAPGAGSARIPVGAVGAVGVSFDVPFTPGHEETLPLPHPKPKRSPAPPDPFADPPDTSPPTPVHRHRGTSL